MIYSFQLLRLAPACGRPWCGRVNYGRYFCTAVDGFRTLQFLIYRYCYHLFNRQYFLLMDTLLIRACGFFSFFS